MTSFRYVPYVPYVACVALDGNPALPGWRVVVSDTLLVLLLLLLSVVVVAGVVVATSNLYLSVLQTTTSTTNITDAAAQYISTSHNNTLRRKVKSSPSHNVHHRTALISISLALSQTPVYTARSECIARCERLRPSFRWYSLRLPTEGWAGWVDLGGWLRSEMTFRDVS